MATNPLKSLYDALAADPGLRGAISADQRALGLTAAATMNALLVKYAAATQSNADGLLTPEDMARISVAIYANPADYVKFIEAHGNDNGDVTTGYHNIQNDGGTLEFHGRNFVDTVADAIYHFGFKVNNGRYYNEDGASNETTADVAGWLNYFFNGVNTVFGGAASDQLGSGTYSTLFASARDETYRAGAGADSIWADDGNDVVLAGTGHDISGGGTGNDRMLGEAGNDTLSGDEGRDTLLGGDGDDHMGGDDGADLINGGGGNDRAGGGAGNDSLNGGLGRDSLSGDDGRDRISGGAGADSIWGGDAADLLLGDDGNDSLSGGEGADFIRAGKGADTVTLWEDVAAQDTLKFALGDSGKTLGTLDLVQGFEHGSDKINLAGFDQMRFTTLDYIGDGRASCYFDGHYLRIDASGDGATDMIVEFSYVETMTASDFLFT